MASHYTGFPLAVAFLLLVFLGAPLVAEAQQPGKVHRIGVLSPASFGLLVQLAPLGWLAEHGYAEGRDFVVETRAAAGSGERLPELAAELVRLKVDVILTWGTTAIRAAKQATGTIPIVMVAEGDPVKAGLVQSLARPGGNVTGLTILSQELAGKRLQLLKEAVPRLSRIAVLWNPADPEKMEEWKQLQSAAQTLGLRLQSLEARRREEIDAALRAAVRERAGALLVLGSALFFGQPKLLTDFAAQSRLPAMYPSRWFVEAFDHGGLMSYGANDLDVSRRVTAYVAKILKGARPADLPVEQPTQFDLLVNLKAAKAIGLTIPKSVVVRADKVLE